MEKFRWGFIGAGMIAKKALYPAVSKSNTGEIYAVASRDADKAMTISPKGLIYTDGKNPTEFVHQYGKEYATVRHRRYVTYERPIMHINVVKTEIAKKVRFPEKTFGEDRDYGIKLANSGLISSAGFIDKTMYHYYYRTKK